MKTSKYDEILNLYAWLVEENTPCNIEPYFDGFIIQLQQGDIIQHCGSYGSAIGCVEFGYTNLPNVDFCAKTLDEAKEIILNNKEYFITKENI